MNWQPECVEIGFEVGRASFSTLAWLAVTRGARFGNWEFEQTGIPDNRTYL